ncbi:MAG: hypothetical protein EZS28_040603 [Streblomastix strix]|uniref:Uncharacterized protein n=1 Tax=Streblomastix strix TaxID=222440 RepID=A0A5J4U132_9EUKA|nr:MAG: hypothetical protein EZS28_040603 [Streblomastix strix]
MEALLCGRIVSKPIRAFNYALGYVCLMRAEVECIHYCGGEKMSGNCINFSYRVINYSIDQMLRPDLEARDLNSYSTVTYLKTDVQQSFLAGV